VIAYILQPADVHMCLQSQRVWFLWMSNVSGVSRLGGTLPWPKGDPGVHVCMMQFSISPAARAC